MKRPAKIIISGGGTGGHIFPALSIANAIKEIAPDTEILFVGAENRMEMEKIPAAGYSIIGLPVSGFDRKNPFANFRVVARLINSLTLAKKTIRDFKPDVAVGVGGYASGPTLWAASSKGIPTLIQEQNSYAGVTNKLLAKKAKRICVAYNDMERFFPKEKIILTGNPVRQTLLNETLTKDEAAEFFDLDPKKKTLLVVGGSLGARTINQSIENGLKEFVSHDIQVIWQTGKSYAERAAQAVKELNNPLVKTMPFISRMDLAYKLADLVVSRAGASSISELCLLGKPSILVPSPNVAEDHQTKNAQALEKVSAAILVPDNTAQQILCPTALEIIENDSKLKTLAENTLQLALHKSAERIAEMVLELAKNK